MCNWEGPYKHGGYRRSKSVPAGGLVSKQASVEPWLRTVMRTVQGAESWLKKALLHCLLWRPAIVPVWNQG